MEEIIGFPMEQSDTLDIVVPMELDLPGYTVESVTEAVLEQHRKYGFRKFMLAGPDASWRSLSFPTDDDYRALADRFVKVRDAVAPYGIRCGWWETLNIKSGRNDRMQQQVDSRGSVSATSCGPLSYCPLDPVFSNTLANQIALFTSIAKPDFVFLEDDYTLADAKGCFCPLHLKEFARRMGREYTRDEIVAAFSEETPDALDLVRKWRELSRDSLASLGKTIRAATDRKTPEIPIASMQAGGVDKDGDATYAVAKALAGDRHVPASRIYGCFYMGGASKDIPGALFHPLYSLCKLPRPFRCYHEEDSCPSSGFYTSAKQQMTMMTMVTAFGFDGCTFQTHQVLDHPNEDGRYAAAYAAERARLNELRRNARKCHLCGVELCYDPFFNTLHPEQAGQSQPLWLNFMAPWGIPYTPNAAPVAFWDFRQAKYADDETVLRYLSKGLILDADAATILVDRGYGDLLGVSLGNALNVAPYLYDLNSTEVIQPAFREEAAGFRMPNAGCYAKGKNGKHYRLVVTDPNVEVVTELESFQGDPVSPAMTRFENRLGGRVVVFQQSLFNNYSPSMVNYRRQRLMQRLVAWCADFVPFVKESPMVLPIVNLPDKQEDFLAMLTLVNLCDDPSNDLVIHLPSDWAPISSVRRLTSAGVWEPLPFRLRSSELLLSLPLAGLAHETLQFIR